MARKRARGERGRPWYRSTRNQWYVTINAKPVLLLDKNDKPIRGKDNRDAAERAWHEIVVLESAPETGEDNEVRTILELFLQDAEKRQVSAKTIKNYVGFFKSFTTNYPKLLIRNLRPKMVLDWWDHSHPAWNNSTRNLSGSALKAAFRWAASPGKGGAIIPRNPLEGMELPTMRKRSSDVIIKEEEFATLIKLIKTEAVKDILTVAWETGTRPINLVRATAANLTEKGTSLLFNDTNTKVGSIVHKTFKKTGRPLTVPLTDSACEIVIRLAKKYPSGELFRTPTGLPWTDARLANTVRHYAIKAGLEGRFTAYSCRHTRATMLLNAGQSDTDVAAILGNTPSVIHKNYSHITSNVDRLRDIMEKSRPTNA